MAAVPSALPFAVVSALAQSDRHSRNAASASAPAIASGYPSLDRELPNAGWPASTLIELLLANPDVGELRLLAPALKRIVQGGKKLILLAPSHLSFAATLRELGIDMNRVTLIEAEQPADRIASLEPLLKREDVGALLCWLPDARDDQLRRLQLTASGCSGLTFVFRPLPAQKQVSPASLRILCLPMPAGRMSVEIVKRRGPVHIDPIVLSLSMTEIMARSLPARTLARPALNAPSYGSGRLLSSALSARQRMPYTG